VTEGNKNGLIEISLQQFFREEKWSVECFVNLTGTIRKTNRIFTHLQVFNKLKAGKFCVVENLFQHPS
jgi:hypothetical protein